MTPGLPWREEPERSFYTWLQGTFRHARGAMWRLPNAWNALCLHAAGGGRHVADATVEDVRRLVQGLPVSGRPSAMDAQRRRVLEVLHLAFESMRAQGLREDNPVSPVLAGVPPVARPLPIVLAESQRSALVQALHASTGDWREQRDRAIALLVMVDGLRPAEVAALRPADLVQSDGQVAVLRDGARRRRPLRLNRHTRRALTRWLEVRAQAPGKTAELVFPNDVGTRFVPADLYRLVRQFLRRAGIEARNLGHLDIRDCVSLRAARREGLTQRSSSRPAASLPARFA
jgi:site-specific recombinase XerD